MIEKIFNALFSKNKKSRCLTLVKDREVYFDAEKRVEIKRGQNGLTTCLTKYFVNRQGLNKNEREQFYFNVLCVRGRQ